MKYPSNKYSIFKNKFCLITALIVLSMICSYCSFSIENNRKLKSVKRTNNTNHSYKGPDDTNPKRKFSEIEQETEEDKKIKY